MKTTIIAALILTLAISIGCEEYTIVDSQAPTVQELEAIVKGNSLTLIEAVEEFANDNNGYYPQNADSDTTLTGKILIDYLPEGERLVNPFTGVKDQPINSTASQPGEIGYFKLQPYYNIYSIQGYGVSSIIVEHDNIDETEALLIKQCLEIQQAVEEWRVDNNEIGNHYPCQTSDYNQLDNLLQDYLDGGQLLENLFTGAKTEPVVWGNFYYFPGQIGYKCHEVNGVSVGYSIAAVGHVRGIIIFQIDVN